MIYNKKKTSDSKESYHAVPIPDRLEAVVNAAILMGKTMKSQKTRPIKIVQFAASFVFVITTAFIIMVNTMPVFAKELSTIPVLGQIARFFSFQKYDEIDDGNLIHVNIPAIENTGNTEMEKRLNYEIAMKMQEQIKAEKEAAREYKKAFLETGGKESEYMPIEINLDYKVHCNNSRWISFVITKYISASYFYSESYFYNYDTTTGKEIELKHLLSDKYGENYIEDASNVIKAEIARREQIGDNAYFTGDEAFKRLKEDQNFYINAAGNPVIVFDKYEIAFGYMGIQEFEIPVH